MYRRCQAKSLLVLFLVVAVGLTVAGVPAHAQIEEGTVVNAENFDRLKDRKFAGKTLDEMIPPEVERLIKEEGWKLSLSKESKFARTGQEKPIDEKFYQATEKYRGQIELNSQTKLYEGNYKGGLPFPEIDLENDPNAGYKLAWNWYLAQPFTRAYELGPFAFPLIDDNSGIDRNAHWYGIKYYLKNQYGNLPQSPVENPGEKMIFKRLMFAQYPEDIAGLGTYIERFTDGRLDNSWAYISALRRTRRLTGGSWMDPIDGSDWLSDDFQGMSGNPAWYNEIEYKETKTILRPVRKEGAGKPWDRSAGSVNEQYKTVDLDAANACAPAASYWEWIPTEVYVLEATMPEKHPYSTRTLYLDKDLWYYAFGFGYDKTGDLWKVVWQGNEIMESHDGVEGMVGNSGNAFDVKSQHCSPYLQPDNKPRPPGITSRDVSLSNLKQGEAPRP